MKKVLELAMRAHPGSFSLVVFLLCAIPTQTFAGAKAIVEDRIDAKALLGLMKDHESSQVGLMELLPFQQGWYAASGPGCPLHPELPLEAWERFRDRYEERLNVDWDLLTGTPEDIRGKGFLIQELEGVDGETEENMRFVEGVGRRFLADNYDLFQVADEDLLTATIRWSPPRYPTQVYGKWMVSFTQEYSSLPIYRSWVRILTSDANIVSIVTRVHPCLDLDPEPSLSLDAAVEIASDALGVESPLEPVQTELLVYPLRGEDSIGYALAWRMTFSYIPEPSGSWEFIIDAHAGTVLSQMDLRIFKKEPGN